MPTVLITGASRGFGRELFHVFAEKGWAVFPLVRDAQVAQELAAIRGAVCRSIVADVTSVDVEDQVIRVLHAHTASLDLLINNAGSIKKRRGLQNTTPEDLEALFRVHCVGVLRCTRAALPFLRKASRPIVVNITSRWGSIARTLAGGGSGIYSYQIAKCAQNMLTACLDQELKEQGIRVFAVHPGRLKTAVAAPDADVPPREAALKLAEWVCSVDPRQGCGCHDLVGGGLIPW